MNSHVKRFYQQTNEEHHFEHVFYEVLFLEKGTSLSFEKVKEMAPNLLKGWYELSQLSKKDRIEFTRDFWLKVLPFHPKTYSFFEQFFYQVEDVGIYLTKDNPKAVFEPEFIYSLENCFFRGFPPASLDLIQDVKDLFHHSLPKDFLSFNQIHNGFRKHTDTGILFLQDLKSVADSFHKMLFENERIITCNDKMVDPFALYPFYQCFDLYSYQCFYGDWYPSNEMGNVYFSGVDFTISNYLKRDQNLAFPTFLDWLMFYLEQIET